MRARTDSLLQQTLRRWSLPKSRTRCCQFHLALDELEATLEALRRRPCGSLAAARGIFCNTCKIYCMAVAGEECDLCFSVLLRKPRANATRTNSLLRVNPERLGHDSL